MKTLLITVSTFIMLYGQQAYAQRSPARRYTTDPSYSVHNYKHPNKSVKARQLASGQASAQFVIIKEIIPSLAHSKRNYKKYPELAQTVTRRGTGTEPSGTKAVKVL